MFILDFQELIDRSLKKSGLRHRVSQGWIYCKPFNISLTPCLHVIHSSWVFICFWDELTWYFPTVKYLLITVCSTALHQFVTHVMIVVSFDILINSYAMVVVSSHGHSRDYQLKHSQLAYSVPSLMQWIGKCFFISDNGSTKHRVFHSGQNRRLKMRLPVLRSMRRASLSKDQFEGVVVDYLQVRWCTHAHTHHTQTHKHALTHHNLSSLGNTLRKRGKRKAGKPRNK